MNPLKMIVKTELHQLKYDKRLITALAVYLFIFLMSFTVLTLSHYYEASDGTHNVPLYVFCILSFSIASLVAADITAGEKERNTIEALLMTQCPRSLIIWGKYLVVLLFASIPVVFGFTVLLLLKCLLPSGITNFGICRLLLLLFPFPALISMVLLHNGFKSKTIRSAKSFELTLFLILPLFSFGLGYVSGWMIYVPYLAIMAFLIVFFYRLTHNYVHSEKFILSHR